MSLKKNFPHDPAGARREPSLTTGYLWTFGSTALPLISAFVASLIIARWMGPRVAGLINWTMALATILLIPAKFGIEGASSRLVSEYSVSRPRLVSALISAALVMRLTFTLPVSVATFLLAPLLAGFFNEEALTPLFRTSSLLVFAVSLNELVALIVVGLKRFRSLFLMRAGMLILKTGLVGAVAVYALGPDAVILVYTASALLPAALMYIALSRYAARTFPSGGSRHEVRGRLLRLSAPLAVSGASVTIYSLLDKLMIGYYQGASPVGIYSIARNLLETSLFPTFALVMTLRPMLAGYWAGGERERCRELVRGSLLSSFFYASAVILVFSCLSGPLVTGLFSSDFAPSARILVIFLPLVMMRSLGSVILPGLIAADKAGTYARLTLLGAILNFGLNMALIPRWGAEGAVVSTLLSYMPVEVLGLASLWKALPGFWSGREWGRAARSAACAALLAVLYRAYVQIPTSLAGALVHSAVLTVTFAAMLVTVRAVTPAWIARMSSSFRRRGSR